jgi:hypothetical protein
MSAAATAATKYQNISANELFEYLSKNPNRGHSLKPIEILPPKEEVKTATLDVLGLPQLTAIPMNPSSLLGIFHWIADPLYGLALPNIRAGMLREFATALQEKTDTLQGTSLARKRRKIHDWIGAIAGGSQIKDEDWEDCYGCISLLQGIQLVLVRRQTTEEGEEVVGTGFKGEISFATNPMNWSGNKPVWIADYRGRWLGTPIDSAENLVGAAVSIWLGSLETSGWIVHWPEADGTKEEIVTELKSSPTWQTSDSKLKKEILSKRLGRIKTFEALRTVADEI